MRRFIAVALLTAACGEATDVDVDAAVMPTPDARAEVPDPEPDVALAEPDMAQPEPDMGPADLDMDPSAPDMETVEADMGPAAPDMLPIAPDAAPCDVAIVATVGGALLEELAFDATAARGPARSLEVTLTNVCDRAVRFLGHPDDWIDDPHFTLDGLPPIELVGGESATIGLRFVPDDAGEVPGVLALPYDGPGAPLELDLHATVEPARRIVFIGDGRHVITVDDYGETVVHDSFETLRAHGDELQRGVAWGNGNFVAVGGNVDARWWVSPDGVEWTAYDHPDLGVMNGVAFGGGRFVAIGGTPRTSVDGHSWTAGAGPRGMLRDHLRNIVAIDDYFVAVGDLGRVAISYTGEGWDVDFSFGLADGGVTSAAVADGRLVVVGSGGFAAVSLDRGATWETTLVPGVGDFRGLTWIDGYFYATDGSRTARSVDGLAWSVVNAGAYSLSLGYGRMLLGTTGNAIGRSVDGGFSWERLYESPEGLPIGRAAVEGLR